ncbi:hypothetical protein J6590_038038 [Homalodisca vitripennis]|nr:hypothetical protein J6590_038038 [Homalodisca vitripennis]
MVSAQKDEAEDQSSSVHRKKVLISVPNDNSLRLPPQKKRFRLRKPLILQEALRSWMSWDHKTNKVVPIPTLSVTDILSAHSPQLERSTQTLAHGSLEYRTDHRTTVELFIDALYTGRDTTCRVTSVSVTVEFFHGVIDERNSTDIRIAAARCRLLRVISLGYARAIVQDNIRCYDLSIQLGSLRTCDTSSTSKYQLESALEQTQDLWERVLRVARYRQIISSDQQTEGPAVGRVARGGIIMAPKVAGGVAASNHAIHFT